MGREKRSKFANDAKSTADLASSLAQKATKSEVDTAIANMGSASPKGTYATLAALQTAFPTGTTGVYLVTSDGKWYYWNGSAWTAGGTYQSAGLLKSEVLDTLDFPTIDPPINATNIITNGDFSNGTTGYGAAGGSIAVASNIMSFTAGGSSASPFVYQVSSTPSVVGHKIYYRYPMRVTNAVCQSIKAIFGGGTSGSVDVKIQTSPTEQHLLLMDYIQMTQGMN
jgi:hypothetical protein